MHIHVNLKILLGISISVIILLAQTSSVTAVNDQGLVWGVEVGNRFDYNFELRYHNTTVDLIIDSTMYVIINELYSIPDHVTSINQLLGFHIAYGSYTTYWANGSIMDYLWSDYVPLGAPFIVYPVGNWSLMAQLFESTAPTAEINQDSTTLNYTVANVPNPPNVLTTVFLKSNGVPLSQLNNVTWGSETTIYFEQTLIESSTTQSTTTSTTTGTNTGMGDNITILMMGGVAAIIVLVIVFFIVRRK